MQIQQNISLKPYNTFHIDVYAKYLVSFTTLEDLSQLTSLPISVNNTNKPLVLGGGSNILFTQHYDGLIIKNEMKGIELTAEDESCYYVKAAAGENWHLFVQHCIQNNYAGVENLSLIPGNVGASPMQNIGAYGVEIEDVFHELQAYHLADNEVVTFKKDDCKFGYRDSVFKGKFKNEFIITSVTFRLNKIPQFVTTYGSIMEEIEKMGLGELSIQAVSQAVINIRRSKLPDPAVIGNAGSFFKNPTVLLQQFQKLKDDFPSIVGYPLNSNSVKLAAGWLIEQCGWKGFRKGDAGCHEKQALVLVNYGNANGLDIYTLSAEIMHSVEAKFKVLLEREVNII